jgi:hypothetical protein
MLRITQRALFAAFATSVVVVAVACGSPTPPTPSAAAPTVAPASLTPTPAATALPDLTPAASPTPAAMGPGSWTVVAPIIHGHSYGATLTVLLDGRVLVTGGEGATGMTTAAADMYDPTTGRWTPTRKMFAKRRGHVAALLADGRVLVAGGYSYNELPPIFAEVFDPATATWTKTSPMIHWRYGATATTMTDGRVLVAGGTTENGSMRHAEIYDPAADTWTAARNMAAAVRSATLLADGRVLVMHDDRAPEAFDPAAGRWRKVAAAPMGVPWAAAVRLGNGDVLYLNSQLATGELYDPAADSWTAIDVPHTGGGLAVALDDGSVLVVGNVSSARFDPVTGAWSPVARPPLGRDYALDSIDGVEVNLMAELRDGRVLATSFGSAAIYDPTAGD